jgi:pathogenesis-related protein 1
MTIERSRPVARLRGRAGIPQRLMAASIGSVLSLLLLYTPAGSAADEALLEPMLAAHNRVRAAVGVPPLEWSTELADSAQDWVDRLAAEHGCRMRHSGAAENLYWGSALVRSDGQRKAQQIEPEMVVDAWASERRYYDHRTNECTPGQKCGHYTQIVWRNTEAVGCASRICSDQAQLWACQYEPAGNIIGRRPY